MALLLEGGGHGDVFDKLEQDQLSCAVCLGVYEDPRSLPCLHTFCKTCLEYLPLVHQEGEPSLACPTCRKLAALPRDGVTGFPVSFQIVGLLDFVKDTRAKPLPTGGGKQKKTCDHCQSEKVTDYCQDCRANYCTNCVAMHNGCEKHQPAVVGGHMNGYGIEKREKQLEMCLMHRKPLDTFCECCEDIICVSCVKKWPHSEHMSSCIQITEAISRYRELLMDRLNPIHKQIDLIGTHLKQFTCRESEIAEQSDTVKAQIHSRAEYLINMILASEEGLARKVDEVINSKLGALAEKRESIESTQDELKNLKESVDLCLKTGNNEEILKTTKRWIPKINQIIMGVDITLLNPSEVADLSFVPNNVSDDFNNLGNLSSTFEGLDPRCNIQLVDSFLFVDKSPEVAIVFSIHYTSLPFVIIPLTSIKAHIQPPPNASPARAYVESGDSPNHYKIKFQPSSNGYYQINIKVDDIDVEPQSVLIPFNPIYLSSVRPTAVMKNIRKPIGLAVAEDKRIIVLNDFNEVVIVDRFGRNPKIYSRPEGGQRFTATRHAAVTSDNCFIMTDKFSILKVTMDGKLVASVGRKGSGPLQFDQPFGITIDPKDGKIYVAELFNHRVQVLNPDFSFSHFIGSQGTGFGQFSQPNGIALDGKGNVFVTDTFNHRIQKFDERGKYLDHFGSEGSNEGQLKYPEKIVIANDYLYVTEHSNSRVSVFSTEGKYILCFGKRSGEGGLVWPRGITFDNDGSLYVCDFRGHCIYKY